MVVGESSCFHTLYPVVLGCGLRVCHFDKEGELLSQKASSVPDVLLAAVQLACSQAECVLVAVEHIVAGGFPAAAFQHIVLYASEPELQARLQVVLAETPRPQHVLQVELGPSQPERLVPPGPGLPAGAAGAGRLLPAAQPHAAAPAAHQPAGPVAAAPAVATAPQGRDWPLVVSSDPSRPIRTRRGLYESVLQLEREGACVVERKLGLVDLVLSPSAALIVHDNSAQGHVGAVWQRLHLLSPGCAFLGLAMLASGAPEGCLKGASTWGRFGETTHVLCY